MHCVEPSSDVVPGGHRVHSLEPCSGEKEPAGHFVMTLEPSHREPDGHSEQLVRVVSSFPEVNEPSGQIEQDSALLPLYRLSAPHSAHPPLALRYVPARQNEHCAAPASDVVPFGHLAQRDAPGFGENEPASHSVMTLVPSHAEPMEHSMHSVRVT